MSKQGGILQDNGKNNPYATFTVTCFKNTCSNKIYYETNLRWTSEDGRWGPCAQRHQKMLLQKAVLQSGDNTALGF